MLLACNALHIHNNRLHTRTRFNGHLPHKTWVSQSPPRLSFPFPEHISGEAETLTVPLTQACCSAYIPSPICLSINLSLRPSVTRVDQSKMVEVRIMQFSPYSSRIHLDCAGYISSRNYDGIPSAAASNNSRMGKTSYFLAVCDNISTRKFS